MLHNRIVQRLITDLLADLDHAGNLVRLAFAHEVGDGRSEDEDFQRRDTPFLVDPLEQVLGNNPFEGFGKGRANLVLLLGRKDVDDTIHGLRGVRGVQRAEDQMTGAGRDQRQLDRLKVTQLADEDYVRILAQRSTEGGGEGLGVDADFAVVDEAVFAFVDEFDGVLDGNDVVAASTGHLVLGTLHTPSAAKTVDRIIDVFPAEQQNKIRATLSEALKGVIAQNLFKRIDKKGRVAALEILVFTTAIANLVREGKTHQIPGMIQVGKKIGNQPLDDAIMEHLRMKRISPEEAYDKAMEKKKFRTFLPQPPDEDEN